MELMITKGFQTAVGEFEKTWRDWVLKNYK
jgi:hypothetical protein